MFLNKGRFKLGGGAEGRNSARGRRQEPETTKYVEELDVDDTGDDEVLGLFTAEESGKEGRTPIQVSVMMLGQNGCRMQLDTGATVSILPKILYDQQFKQWPLRSTNSGVQIPVYGEIHLPVVYEQEDMVLPLIVADGDGPPLLGRNWLKQLKSVNWHSIFVVSQSETLSDVLDRHKNVFNTGLGTIEGFKADIQLQESAKPVFCKARSVPYALRQKVEK